MRPENLFEIWDNLALATSGIVGLDRRLLDVEAPVGVYACVFWPGGQPGLLVEGEGTVRPTGGRLPKCRGVKLVHETLGSNPDRTSVRILLEEPRLRDIFAILAIDLLDVARSQSTSELALRRCIDRISMWQGLFERLPADGLSDEAQRGLFGELWVLENLMLEVLDLPEAVEAWRGPDPGNQDFVRLGVAIEVKTTLAKRHSRLPIANEKQLDEVPHSILYLANVRLDESAAAGRNLNDLVGNCRQLVASDLYAARLLDDCLLKAGYLDVHANLYQERCWQVSGCRFFHVHDHFPRLTEANVPPGVGDIKYSVIADDLSQYECQRSDVAKSLEETTNGD